MNAIQALSQLSYNPMGEVDNTLFRDFVKYFPRKKTCFPAGGGDRLSEACKKAKKKARILQCEPLHSLVELDRIELTTS